MVCNGAVFAQGFSICYCAALYYAVFYAEFYYMARYHVAHEHAVLFSLSSVIVPFSNVELSIIVLKKEILYN